MKYIIALLVFTFAANDALTQKDEISIPLRTWKSEEERIKEQQQVQKWRTNLDEYISQKQKVASNLGKSALLPGMGQFSCKKVGKGGLFLGSTIVTFGGGIYFLFQSNDRYEQYKEADNIDDIEKYWDESEKLLKYSKILAGAGAVIWFINIIDTYLTTNRYNEVLFREFYFGLRKGSISPRIGVNNNKIEIKLVYEY